ncbi:MAG: hypothetical protein AAFQ82_11355 [Myxococcota bacterium]
MVSPRAPVALCALACTLLCSSPARAAFDQLTLAVEPGLATLSEPDGRSWGGLGAISGAVNLSDRLHLQLHLDYKRFPFRDNSLQATAVGGELVYNIDVGRVTPFIELGGAAVTLLAEDGASDGPSLVPLLGAGFDVKSGQRFFWGFTVRYYPIFGTDLLSNPAYVTINARLGVRFGGT